jgi:lipoate-protein ligase A
MPQNGDQLVVDAEAALTREWAIFQAVEAGTANTLWHVWESARPVVVLGRHTVAAEAVLSEACRTDGVEIVRRFSGGGAVVLGAGCLNYAVALSLVARPHLDEVERSFALILHAIASSLGLAGLSRDGTDLVLDGAKVSGNAQRRGRRALIQHGTLLYDFDARLVTRYLREPARQPAYRGRRRHEAFMGNLPLTAETVRTRVLDAFDGGLFR